MLKVAIAGLGGFGAMHHAAVRQLEDEGLCKVVATCDPFLASLGSEIEKFQLQERGVSLFSDFDQMLLSIEGLDLVTLASPIPVHAAQHAATLARGAACYLEKPPTLWFPEFLSMLEQESKAPYKTQVGFNFVGDPMRRALKARIVAGEFGKVRTASLLAYWPRDRAYYQRSNWAGKLKLGDQWVCDSCIGNALAHNVQDLLFWCGHGSVESVAVPTQVQANLYRAHPIESFDTVFLAADVPGNIQIRIAATHTGLHRSYEKEIIECERAKITVESSQQIVIQFTSGEIEVLDSEFLGLHEFLTQNIRSYIAYLSDELDRPTTTFEDSRGFVALLNLALLSAENIGSFNDDRLEWDSERGAVEVLGLAEQIGHFVTDGQFPFTPKSKWVSISDIDHIDADVLFAKLAPKP